MADARSRTRRRQAEKAGDPSAIEAARHDEARALDLRGASFSPCRRYRYVLYRTWGNADGARVTFVCLNPSTADEAVDDPTVRRCMGFARRWGYHGLDLVNLFAFRATDPKVLRNLPQNHPDRAPWGQGNDEAIVAYVRRNMVTVCAWGTHGAFLGREKQVLELLRSEGLADRLYCLGTTKAGHPKHPLYLPNDAERLPWPCRGPGNRHQGPGRPPRGGAGATS